MARSRLLPPLRPPFQAGALALPLYFLGRGRGTPAQPERPWTPAAVATSPPRLLLRNATLVLAADEVAYLSTWLRARADLSTAMSPALVQWLNGAIPPSQVGLLLAHAWFARPG